MAFSPGDAVHVKLIGKGIVREVRNGGRLLVDVNGRAIVAREDEVTSREEKPPRKVVTRRSPDIYVPPAETAASIDLHGLTVEKAVEMVSAFLDGALRSGVAEARIIHGRSGGRIKAAVHAQLKRIASIRGFAVDPRNPGVTIVKL
jgi:DNA mismatch repair protein MutS2